MRVVVVMGGGGGGRGGPEGLPEVDKAFKMLNNHNKVLKLGLAVFRVFVTSCKNNLQKRTAPAAPAKL